MDVLKAVQTYVTKMITEVPGMKVLLLDAHTVSSVERKLPLCDDQETSSSTDLVDTSLALDSSSFLHRFHAHLPLTLHSAQHIPAAAYYRHPSSPSSQPSPNSSHTRSTSPTG